MNEEKRVEYVLRDYSGATVQTFSLKAPLQHPYIFWHKRLFVASRDEPNILLERSYHVFMMAAGSNEKH